jgi:hypothetical protein
MIRPFPKPHPPRVGDRSMTYISAFRCLNGLVMCADTQETIDGPASEKQYSEKLYVLENRSYPLAIGGAGLPEPIEALSQEVMNRVEREKPPTIRELRDLIASSIEYVYQHDLPVSAWPKQYRTAEYLIAAKPPRDNFVILRVKGKRIYRAGNKAIIGYATAPNYALLKRLHRDNLVLHQGVLLALYLVTHAKAVNEGVGFDTQVAVVIDAGAWLEPKNEIVDMENRFNEITAKVDQLLLASSDLGMTESSFDSLLADFKETVSNLRYQYKEKIAEQVAGTTYTWPYEKLPTGSRIITSHDDAGKRTMLIYDDEPKPPSDFLKPEPEK